MNTLENKIHSDLTLAMKDQDKSKMEALRSVIKAIQYEKAAPGGKKELEDTDIIKFIKKQAKQREESIKMYKDNNRLDLVENEQLELDVLNKYLPKMLSKEEVEFIVTKTIAELGAVSMKDMGKVMGFINKTYAGQVDGSMVSGIVKNKLS